MPKSQPGDTRYRPAAGTGQRGYGSGYDDGKTKAEDDLGSNVPEFEVATVDTVAEVIEAITAGLPREFQRRAGKIVKKEVPDYYGLIQRLAMVGVTPREIEWLIEGAVSVSTNGTEVIDERFVKEWEIGSAKLNLAIRLAQIRKALSGDSRMLKHLGKHLLGQTDQLDVSVGHRIVREQILQLPASVPEDEFAVAVELMREKGTLPGSGGS